MRSTVVKFGLYGAITVCLLFLLGLFLGERLDLGYTAQEVIGYTTIVVSLLFVFFGIKQFRDKENKGKISLGKGLLVGVLISLMTALAFGMLDLIYVKYINPDFMAEYYSHSVEQIKASLSGEELKVQLAKMEQEKELFANPIMNFVVMSTTVFIIGFIISLISSLILQRK